MLAWNPIEAEKVLKASPLVTYGRTLKKLVGFRARSGRELAVSSENTLRVTIYLSVAPCNMPDVCIEGSGDPAATCKAREADLNALCPTLGLAHPAQRLNVKSKDALEALVYWYQYA